MKTTIVVSLLFICSLGIIFGQFRKASKDNRTAVSIKETSTYYYVSAQFDPDKTKALQSYLDDRLTGSGDLSFRNTQLDATITLDDSMTFYVKLSPGNLVLKFDKDKNSEKAYNKFKKMGSGLDDLLTD